MVNASAKTRREFDITIRIDHHCTFGVFELVRKIETGVGCVPPRRLESLDTKKNPPGRPDPYKH